MTKKQDHIVYEYICDICGCSSKSDSDYWANNYNGGAVTIAEDGLNGVDTRNWEHLCRSCRKEIQDAVDAVAKKRGGADWWKRTVGHKSQERSKP